MKSKAKTVIPDHIFGDLDLLENSAPWQVKRLSGVHHYNRKNPCNPRPGDEVRLVVSTSDEQVYSRVRVWYSTDEWATRQELTLSKTELIWDTPGWGGLQYWEGTLPAQDKGTMLRYRLAAYSPCSEKWLFADDQAEAFDQATNYSIWYDKDKTPEWAKKALVYQVFVDRFNPGRGRQWAQTEDLTKPFGGTLSGVTQKLDDIQRMGFDTLWLSPIFSSPSHHAYDVSDYYQINPRFGSGEDFDSLLEKAHNKGMRVILDFVVNHCSNQHPAFLDAQAHQDSPYHDWFTWEPWPESYQCFYEVKEMPELDLSYGKPARAYLLECARYWLRRGVDGFRLDYAHGPEQDFWVDFRRACRRVNPACWTFGEVVAPADIQASFAGGIDGSLDFLLCQALRLTFAQQTWPLSRLAGFLESHWDHYPADFSLPAFIDNHDMNRFIFSAHADVRLLKLALLLLYALPQPPVIYYGTEFGLSQKRSIHSEGGLGFDEARLPMDWEKAEGEDLRGYLAQLANMRKVHAAVRHAKREILHCDDQSETLVLAIGAGKERLWVALNRSELSQVLTLNVSEADGLYNGLNAEYFKAKAGQLRLTLSPLSGLVLVQK